MNNKVIDGKKIAKKILNDTKSFIEASKLNLHLVIVLASNDEASVVYTNLKKKRAEEIGIRVTLKQYEENTSVQELKGEIETLNNDKSVNGVLLQLPFFQHLDKFENEIVNTLNPEKDVDGLTAIQQARCDHLLQGAVLPATVAAAWECLNVGLDMNKSWEDILGENGNDKILKGINVAILNNTTLIGKPFALLCSNLGATVTIANEFTQDIVSILKEADVIVSATGKTELISSDMIKEGAVAIDVTSMKNTDGEIVGDFIFDDEMKRKLKAFTPVPGGVGPLTIACLLRNLAFGT